ncbi:hypothetical protein MMC06_004714, partial [Schaereria dolodes]|nr:hypothetical protein [Schaereria dolodes]
MAGWIINRCVAATGGIGGFSTLAIQNLVNYVNNPDTDISAPYAWDVAFITLAVTNLRDTKPSPGEYDPLVPILLFDSLITSSEEAPRGSALQQSFRSKAYSFYFAISDAQRGAMTPWWRAA